MLILPAIDLREGKCVRLFQGDYSRQSTYDGDPVEVARAFEDQGADILHVVDLDAAKSGLSHESPTIERIARALTIPVEVGGGVRSVASARRLLEIGVSRVICGTALVKAPELAEEMFANLGAQIVAGIDARDGKVALSGWRDQTDIWAWDLAQKWRDLGCQRVIITDIARDGTFLGPNLDLLERLSKVDRLAVIQSGGVGNLEHVREIVDHGIAEGVIIGRALYEDRLTVSQAVDVAKARSIAGRASASETDLGAHSAV